MIPPWWLVERLTNALWAAAARLWIVSPRMRRRSSRLLGRCTVAHARAASRLRRAGG